tara:strand:+ start:1 stop:1245 length:1245 start_codon:yes stop_codon:yes gene_type:complete
MMDFLRNNKKNIFQLRQNTANLTTPTAYRRIKKIQDDVDVLLSIDKQKVKKDFKKNKDKSRYVNKKDHLVKAHSKIKDLKKDLLAQRSLYVSLEKELNLKYSADFDHILNDIRQFYSEEDKLSELIVSNFMHDFLDQYYLSLTKFKYTYAALLDLNNTFSDYRSDKKGFYISLRFKGTWPTLGINSIKLNGQSEDNIFNVEMTNFKSSMFEKGNELTFSLNQSDRSPKGFSLFGVGATEFNKSGSRFESYFKLVQNSSYLLDREKQYLDRATTMINVNLDYFNSILDLDFLLNISDIKFSRNLSNVVVRSFLSSLNNVDFNFKLSGPLDQLDYSVSSTIDDNFAFIYNILKKDQNDQAINRLTNLLSQKRIEFYDELNKMGDRIQSEENINEFLELISDIDQKMLILDKRFAKL